MISNTLKSIDIVAQYKNQDVEISFKNSTDKITIKNYRQTNASQIERFEIVDESSNVTFSAQLSSLINTAPIANNDIATLNEDSSITINVLANDSDPDGHKISINSFTQPTKGVLVKNADGTFIYTPNANYYGADSFTYTIVDELGLKSQSATVNITINSVNDKPILSSITQVNTTEDAATINGTLSATDIDSTTLTYSTILAVEGFTLNSNGTYSFNPAHSSYQSLKAGEIKTITIPVRVSDGSLSDTKDLVIKITGTNDKPVLSISKQIFELKDKLIQSGKIGVTDVDNDVLSYKIITNPTKGNFSVDTNGNYTYTHNNDFSGSQTVIVEVDDTKGAKVQQTLIFNVLQTDISADKSTRATLDINNQYNGILEQSYDKDWVKVNFEAGKRYEIHLIGVSLYDSYLYGIFDKNGNEISGYRNDDSNGTLNSYIQFTATKTEEHFISIGGFSASNGTYKLSISPSIKGTSTNDILNGTSANEMIYALTGNDTLRGSGGQDILMGSSGDDTYIFALGDGKDTIVDTSGTDTIKLEGGISKNNVSIYQNGTEMWMKYSDKDSFSITNWTISSSNKIEKVSLADGNYLSSTDIDKLIQSMSAYATTKGISLSSIDNVSKNAELMTMIANTWHK